MHCYILVITFISYFRPYLIGQQFTLRTDHGALTWLLQFKDPQGQLARWLEKIQEYNFHIVHRKGQRHLNADALSRLLCRQCGRSQLQEATCSIRTIYLMNHNSDDIRQKQLRDPNLALVLKAKESNIHLSSVQKRAGSIELRRLYKFGINW